VEKAFFIQLWWGEGGTRQEEKEYNDLLRETIYIAFCKPLGNWRKDLLQGAQGERRTAKLIWGTKKKERTSFTSLKKSLLSRLVGGSSGRGRSSCRVRIGRPLGIIRHGLSGERFLSFSKEEVERGAIFLAVSKDRVLREGGEKKPVFLRLKGFTSQGWKLRKRKDFPREEGR